MKSKKTKKAKPWKGIGIGVAVLVVVGGLVAVTINSNRSSGENAGVVSHGQPILGVRTVRVSTTGLDQLSMANRPLHVVLTSGTMPASTTMATVLSDENCNPDAAGITHCTNRLRMDGGAEMTVIHPHRMSDVQCLAPGERVRVEAA
ncbi:MAG: hypothetical protein ACXVEX_07495 [Actinomycetota bacterium]